MPLRTDHQHGPSNRPGPRRPLGFAVALVACWALPVIAGVVVAFVVASRSVGGAA